MFAPAILNPKHLLVPTICVAEVYRRASHLRGVDDAVQALGFMLQGTVVDLDAELAVAAASLGLELGLPLADSVIYATGRAFDATVWTQDADFEGLEGVRYFPRD